MDLTMLVSAATFAAYVLISPENVLTPEKAFVTLALFNAVAIPMGIMPMCIQDVIQMFVAAKRLSSYFMADELPESPWPSTLNSDHEVVVKLENASFSWDRDSKTEPLLKNLNLILPKGKLIACVGAVGSGKSSFLSALCGEMFKTDGSIAMTVSNSFNDFK